MQSVIITLAIVALLVSAWIEIACGYWSNILSDVALLVSAWIEMFPLALLTLVQVCRTPRECVD